MIFPKRTTKPCPHKKTATIKGPCKTVDNLTLVSPYTQLAFATSFQDAG
jgi:hypothetical protein